MLFNLFKEIVDEYSENIAIEFEQHNIINFRNVRSYTIERRIAQSAGFTEDKNTKKGMKVKNISSNQKDSLSDKQSEDLEILVIHGDETSIVSEWKTQILNPNEYKKLYSINFFTL